MSLIITGVLDGPLSGGVPKLVELYATDDIADLSSYDLLNFNNGSTAATGEFTLSGSLSAGEYAYAVNSTTDDSELIDFFGALPDTVLRGSGNQVNVNGDDAFQLELMDVVIDSFGVVGVDGTGQPWEYMDGWAYRTDQTGPDGASFALENWSFSGTNALDGFTTNADAGAPFPIGTYEMGAPTPETFEVSDLGVLENATYDNSGLDGREFFFNVTTGSSSFAEFSAVDFDLSTIASGLTATGISEIAVELVDTDPGFASDGEFTVYFSDQTGFDLRDQGGISHGTGNGISAVDPIFGTLQELGTFTYEDTPGLPETAYALTLTPAAEQYIVDELNDADSNDILRLVFAAADGDTTLNGAWAGRTNFDDPNGPEISFTIEGTPADGGTDPDPITAPYSFSFDQTLASEGWTVFSVDADTANTWTRSETFEDVEANGFGNAAAANDWLITPLFDLSALADPVASFETNTRFTDSGEAFPQLDFLYSTDFAGTGDPTAATWISLPFTPSPEDSGTDTPSGEIDLSGLPVEDVYFAFQYQSSGTGGGTSSRWRVDDFAIAEAAVVVEPTARLISEIQGSGAASALQGELVRVTAVVTADYQDASQGDINGFFLQEEDADSDGDATTSEGIFVFEGDASVVVPDVEVGDRIEIIATVDEFDGETQLDQIAALTVLESGVLDEVTPGVITYPLASVTTTDDGRGGTITVGDYEAFEGMLVTVPETMTVGDLFGLGRWNEVGLTSDGRIQNFTQTNAPDVAAYAQFQEDVAKRGLVINDAFYDDQNRDPSFPSGGLNADTGNILRAGDTVSGLTGVIGFKEEVFAEFNYRLIPTETPAFVSDNPRPEEAPEVGGSLTVASFNVLNYFTTVDTNVGNFNGPDNAGPAGNLEPRGAESEPGVFTVDNDGLSEFDRQTAKLVAAITEIDADILGLIEIENEQDPSVATQTSPIAIQALVDAINVDLGAAVYDFVDTGPIEGIQGGDIEGDAIKVGFIYKVDTVTPMGDFAILDESVDPRFETAGTQRPALAQTFTEIDSGESFTAAVNHFKSKGSIATYDDDGDPTTPEVPDAGIGDGQGNNPNIRDNAAKALVDWLATDPTGSGDADVMILGDLNAYLQEDAIQSILAGADDTPGTADDFVSLVGPEDYSFGFPVGLDTVPWVQTYGTLDYALVNTSLYEQVTGSAEWHINADEAAVLDYNLNFQPSNQFDTLFAPDPFRASDHDPLLVGLELGAPEASLDVAIYDADTNAVIAELSDGAEVLVGDLLGRDLTIAAFTPGDSAVESVFLNLNDGQVTQTENVEPYALFGDRSGDFNGREGLFGLGENTITLDLYSADGLRGTLLETVEIDFQVVDDTPSEVLVGIFDAETDELITELADGDVLDPADFDGEIAIAVLPPEDSFLFEELESVRFTLNGDVERVENIEPYALLGDDQGDFRGEELLDVFEVGTNTLGLELFSRNNARGDVIDTLELSLTVLGGEDLLT